MFGKKKTPVTNHSNTMKDQLIAVLGLDKLGHEIKGIKVHITADGTQVDVTMRPDDEKFKKMVDVVKAYKLEEKF